MKARAAAIAVIAVTPWPCRAQVVINLPTVADVQVAKTSADAAAATAATALAAANAACVGTPAVPGMEMVGGSAGTNNRQCRPVNSVQPRLTRTATCALVVSGGVGSCDAVWDSSSFPAGTTVRLAGAPAVTTAAVGASNEQPVTCKAFNLSVTGVSFRCWQAQSSLVSVLGATVLPFAAPASGITVQVTAIPSS